MLGWVELSWAQRLRTRVSIRRSRHSQFGSAHHAFMIAIAMQPTNFRVNYEDFNFVEMVYGPVSRTRCKRMATLATQLLNSPVFNKYGRSLRDFLIVCGLVIVTGFILLFLMFWIMGDAYDGGFTSCGTQECIDQ